MITTAEMIRRKSQEMVSFFIRFFNFYKNTTS
jgi:hypothetical protein